MMGDTFPSIRKWSFMKVRALSEEGPTEHCGEREGSVLVWETEA